MAGIIARQRKDGTKGYMECQPDSEPFIFPYDPRGVSSAFTEGCHDPLQHHGPPERCLDIATAAGGSRVRRAVQIPDSRS